MIRLFRQPKQQIAGDIAFYDLTDWWLKTFDERERDYIENVYKPFGHGADYSLVKGDVVHSLASVSTFLNGLSSWFQKGKDRSIERRILAESERRARSTLDRHFVYSLSIESYYRTRDTEPDARERAISYCERQIALANDAAKAFRREPGWPQLPRHVGYEQLAIIREKDQNYEAAMNLAQQAKRGGWKGDWDKRVTRYRERAKGASSSSKRSSPVCPQCRATNPVQSRFCGNCGARLTANNARG